MSDGKLKQQDRLASAALTRQQRDVAQGEAVPHAPFPLRDRLGVVAREIEPHQSAAVRSGLAFAVAAFSRLALACVALKHGITLGINRACRGCS